MDNQNSSIPGVSFEDSGWRQQIKSENPQKTPKIVKLVMKISGGLIKTEKQANYALLVFIAAAIIISLILIFNSGSVETPIPPPTPFEEGKL